MKLGLIALIVVGLILLVGIVMAGSLFGTHNELVQEREAIKGSWAQVDVVLQRRADLIPNLVETVKGYAKHEETAIDSVTSARGALGGAQTPKEKIAANSQLDSALSRLLVVVENYPNLKANENFMRLQDELAGTENRIAVERKRYNDAIETYNVYIAKFPQSIYAGWA